MLNQFVKNIHLKLEHESVKVKSYKSETFGNLQKLRGASLQDSRTRVRRRLSPLATGIWAGPVVGGILWRVYLLPCVSAPPLDPRSERCSFASAQ